MYAKALAMGGTVAVLYLLLVFEARSMWQAAGLSVALGLAMAGIGFNVQHDGGHQAFSRFPWINKVAAASLDLIGASSYVWRWKHGILHHMYGNVEGLDPDIQLGFLGRLSPHQKWWPFHRWQHIYLWPLYGLMAIRWHVYDDFRDAVAGRIAGQRVPRPRGGDLALFLGGKFVFFSLALWLPSLRHPFLQVLSCYVLCDLVLGLVLSVVFQLAHVVEPAEFSLRPAQGEAMDECWARHQVAVSVDFSRQSRLATWFLGGLNFQVEHHLFPRIAHVHYPAISPLVEEVCREHGVPFHDHGSFLQGIASHRRWLRSMGARPVPTPPYLAASRAAGAVLSGRR